MSVILNSIEAF